MSGESINDPWWPIETAPRDETGVLLYGPHGHGVLAAYWDADEGLWATLDGLGYPEAAFTHWMPQPGPPQ